jgi:hypothetical protein
MADSLDQDRIIGRSRNMASVKRVLSFPQQVHSDTAYKLKSAVTFTSPLVFHAKFDKSIQQIYWHIEVAGVDEDYAKDATLGCWR